jgi:probable rRNA maturation factor
MPLEPDSPETDPLLSEQWQTDGGSHLDMVIDRQSWPADVIDAARPALTRATDIACEVFGWPCLEIGALFCGDDRIRELNSTFRGKDRPTNVLSFPSGDEDNMPDVPVAYQLAMLAPGEIAIAYETLKTEAAQDSKPVGDHLTHLWVHGLLHLMGHDHQADGEADLMEAGEIRVLALLGIANPYAHPPESADGEAV